MVKLKGLDWPIKGNLATIFIVYSVLGAKQTLNVNLNTSIADFAAVLQKTSHFKDDIQTKFKLHGKTLDIQSNKQLAAIGLSHGSTVEVVDAKRLLGGATRKNQVLNFQRQEGGSNSYIILDKDEQATARPAQIEADLDLTDRPLNQPMMSPEQPEPDSTVQMTARSERDKDIDLEIDEENFCATNADGALAPVLEKLKAQRGLPVGAQLSKRDLLAEMILDEASLTRIKKQQLKRSIQEQKEGKQFTEEQVLFYKQTFFSKYEEVDQVYCTQKEKTIQIYEGQLLDRIETTMDYLKTQPYESEKWKSNLRQLYLLSFGCFDTRDEYDSSYESDVWSDSSSSIACSQIDEASDEMSVSRRSKSMKGDMSARSFRDSNQSILRSQTMKSGSQKSQKRSSLRILEIEAQRALLSKISEEYQSLEIESEHQTGKQDQLTTKPNSLAVIQDQVTLESAKED